MLIGTKKFTPRNLLTAHERRDLPAFLNSLNSEVPSVTKTDMRV
jgi:hypothetical protein